MLIFGVFFPIFLLLHLKMVLFCFGAISPQSLISTSISMLLMYTAKPCCLQAHPGWATLHALSGACSANTRSPEWTWLCCWPNTFWQYCMSVTRWSQKGNLKSSIFVLRFSHQNLCKLKMYFDRQYEVKKVLS